MSAIMLEKNWIIYIYIYGAEKYAEKLNSLRVGDKWIWISSNVLTI